jgi:hypothetical protein
VFFDGNSGTGTITLSSSRACRSLNATGFTGEFAHTGGTLSIGNSSGGSLTYDAGMTYSDGGNYSFVSTTTGNTVTWAGFGLSGDVTFNGAGGGWTIQDAFTTSAEIRLTAGTLDFNDQDIICGNIASNNANTRTLDLGASNIIVTGASWNCLDGTNLTVSTSGSLIDMFNGGDFFSGGKSWGAIIFNTGTGTGGQIYDNPTFSSFTVDVTGSDDFMVLAGDMTVTGNISLLGEDATNKLWFISDGVTQRTVTCNGTVTANYTEFSYIIGDGSASWDVSGGTGNIDGGNNSGITFTGGGGFQAAWAANCNKLIGAGVVH